MKVANTAIGSESVAVGLRGKSVLPCDDELATTDASQQILMSALAALSEGRVSEIVEQFADRFTFNDHAFRLEFTDKTRLTEFFEKSREVFPDTTLEIVSLFESGERAIAEWRLSATESVPLGSVSHRIPISFQGSTIIRVENGRIVQWSEYYDQGSYLPIRLGAFFTEWTKIRR
jgi:ketosteroid isomerase-like protein